MNLFHVYRITSKIPYITGFNTLRSLQKLTGHEQHPKDYLLLLEHEHVYTLGKRKDMSGLRFPLEKLQAMTGVSVLETDRGGDVTYHGPGTLMAYPVFHLSNNKIRLRDYVDMLEDVMIGTCKEFGLETYGRISDKRGIWYKNSKLGSVGISVKHRVASHGFALNVCTNLDYFNYINACNIEGVTMTSIQREIGRDVSVDEAALKVISQFQKIFNKKVEIHPQVQDLSCFQTPN